MKKENRFKWEHNKSDEAKAIAGTFARYNYEDLVDMHNETINKLIEEFEKLDDSEKGSSWMWIQKSKFKKLKEKK